MYPALCLFILIYIPKRLQNNTEFNHKNNCCPKQILNEIQKVNQNLLECNLEVASKWWAVAKVILCCFYIKQHSKNAMLFYIKILAIKITMIVSHYHNMHACCPWLLCRFICSNKLQRTIRSIVWLFPSDCSSSKYQVFWYNFQVNRHSTFFFVVFQVELQAIALWKVSKFY